MKKRITAIILTLCFTFILMPFSVVKAHIAGGYSGTILKDNSVIGRYSTYVISKDQSTQQNDLQYFLGDITDDFADGLIIYINFNSYCNGTLRLNITNLSIVNTVYVYGNNIGSWSQTNRAGYIDINLNNTNYIYVYLLSTWVNSGIAFSSFTTTNVIPGNNLPDNYLTYQIPDDRYIAFQWALGFGDYIHYDNTTSYPYINMSTSKSSKVYMKNGDEIYFAFITTGGSPSEYRLDGNFTIDAAGQSYTIETIYNDRYQQANNGEVMLVFKFKYYGYANGIKFTPNFNKIIRPVFIGRESEYMSEETRAFIGLDDLINNPNEDMDGIADDLGDLHDEENDIIGGFESDLTDFNTNMDLDDYDFITDLNDSNTYFKMILNDVFTNSSSVRAFWVIPLILVIITALLGR